MYMYIDTIVLFIYGQVHHVFFKQQYQGVEIVNADANVHVDRFGRVFHYSSSFYNSRTIVEYMSALRLTS